MRDLSSTTGAEGADDDLGGRLPLLNPETISGEQRRLYDRFVEVQVPWARDSGFEMCAREGRLIGPFNALLRAPDISSPFMDWEESLRKSPLLSEESDRSSR
ncbi:MAG TPA: hypothetical protein VGU66_13090 [Candidatus Elarobacter sp.]|nr:hypothetical protein [Candidatus Elarobacter sp.]